MARLQRRKFEDSTDVRVTPLGRTEMVELGDRVVARQVFEPGWRWSTHLKDIAGTATCQSHHLGFALSGRLRVATNDGVEMEIGPGEAYEIPPGHDAWVVGDEAFTAVDFEAMRGFARTDPNQTRRTLTTILMTDIVDSTSRAVAAGQGRWQELVRLHNERAERAIDRQDGRLVKTTGDGVIGLFDSAERAVRAALAIGQAVADLGLEVRAAVQTGEVETTSGDVRGVVVHAAARMMALGGAGEVIASSTVRELLDGSGLEFRDFGVHTLKGLPGERQLYRLSAADSAA